MLRSRRAMVGSLLTLAFKASGTVLMVLTFILAARSVSPAAFGKLAVAFNALSFVAVVATLGQDTLFVRCWSEYYGRDNGLARGAFWAGWKIVAGGIVLACTGVALVGLYGPFGFSPDEVLAGCAFLAGQIMLTYSSNTCRHILNYVVSELNRELTWRLVLLAVVVGALHQGLNPTVFFSAAACGLALAVACQVVALFRGFPPEVDGAVNRTDFPAWRRRAQSMWVSASIESATQYAEVMLLGLLVSPAMAGGYFVAARVANIFSMLGTGLHTYTVSYAANLFFSSQHHQLQSLLRSVMLVAFTITTPILLVILVAGAPILGLFGPHYATHTPTLIVLALGSYVITMAGPSSGILQTTGHERLYSRVILGALVVRTLLLVWLAPRYGALGAALAWTSVNAPVAIGLSITCRRLCGIDPSALGILRQRPMRRDGFMPEAVKTGPSGG